MRSRKLPPSKEEKAALKISTILSDFTLDLDAIGFHLAKATPYVIYRRALEVFDAAQYNKETVEYNRMVNGYDPLF